VSLETELAFTFVNAELAIVSLPLQHTTGNQRAGAVMYLRSFGARLTAGQPELVLAGPDDFLNVGTQAIPSAHLHRRQGEALGGVVLLAVSDNESFEAPAQPTPLGPVRVLPMVPHRMSIEPAILLETADEIPAIVANPLQKGSGGIPGGKEHVVRAAAQPMASLAEPR
jgi:hypothetical protein